MSKLIKIIAVCIALLTITACNGGGGGGGSSSPGSTPPPTNIPFPAFPAGFFSNGHTQTYQLSGSDTGGNTFTGSLTETTQAQTTYNGQPAIPVQGVFSLTNTQTNTSVTVTGTDYYSTDPANLMYWGFTDSTGGVSTPVSVNLIPPTALIGDSGAVGTYAGAGTAAGETDTITWQLTDANNGLANFILSDSTLIGSTLDFSTKIIYVIDQQGNRQSVTIEFYDASSGVTLTLSGN